MPAAARLGDLIGHAPPIPPITSSALIGAALTFGELPLLSEGTWESVAALGSRAVSGDLAPAASHISGSKGGAGAGSAPTGAIIGPCSGNVFINGIPAARAGVDLTTCTLHPPVPLPIASGSSNVFINGLPAARLGDLIRCSAVIITASGNVNIGGSAGAGGDSAQADVIMPEGDCSSILRTALSMAEDGVASLIARPDNDLTAPAKCIAGLMFSGPASLGVGGGPDGNRTRASDSSRASIGKTSDEILSHFDNTAEGRANRALAQSALEQTVSRMQSLESKGFKLSTAEQLEYAQLNSRRNRQAGTIDQIDRQLRQVTPFKDWTPDEWHRTNEAALITAAGLGGMTGVGRVATGGSHSATRPLQLEEIIAPNGKTIQTAVKGNAIVPIEKVTIFSRGKSVDVSAELMAMNQYKQSARKKFDANPANEKRLEQLNDMNDNFRRSTELGRQLDNIGLPKTELNDARVINHLLDAGQCIDTTNRLWAPSVLKGPKGDLKVEATWKILDDNRAYLSTVIFTPIK